MKTSKSECNHWAFEHGTDEQYEEWSEAQPSCISGAFTECINGEWRNQSAHVRRASCAGTAFKPPFKRVPLTADEHAYQHQHGELALLQRHGILPLEATVEEAKDWFNAAAERYLLKWTREKK